MTWFKVDDNLAFHQKVLIAGNEAMGLWVRAGSWSGQQLSDGYVPMQIARMIGSESLAAQLVDVGLWDVVPGGFQFHQWVQHQPTRDQVEARRETDRQRKANARAAKESQQVSARTPGGLSAESALPVPSRPDPTRPEDSSNTDRSSHLGNRANSGDATDELNLSSIRAELSHRADIEAEESEVASFAGYVLAKSRAAVGNQTAYVNSAIFSNPTEVSQWFKQHRRAGRTA